MLPTTVYYDHKQASSTPFHPGAPDSNASRLHHHLPPFPSHKLLLFAHHHILSPLLIHSVGYLSSSHKILLVEPLLVAPPPGPSHQLLVPPPPPLLLLLALPRHSLLFLPPLGVFGALFRALPREVCFLLVRERGGGERRAGFLEAVHGRVEAGWDAVVSRRLRVPEPDLPGRHAGVFAEVRPGRVEDGYVVFFVAWRPRREVSGRDFRLCVCVCVCVGCVRFWRRRRRRRRKGGGEGGKERGEERGKEGPSIEFAFVSCAQSSSRAGGSASHFCSGVRRR